MNFLALLDFVAKFQTPIIAVGVFFIWRIKTNDLPHIKEEIVKVGERVAKLEGVKEGIELERMKK